MKKVMKTYNFICDQLLMPYTLTQFNNSKEVSDAGITYVHEGGSLMPIERKIYTVKEYDLAFPLRPKRAAHMVQLNQDQLKFYFPGITNKEVGTSLTIDMTPNKTKAKKTNSSFKSVGKATSLFEE